MPANDKVNQNRKLANEDTAASQNRYWLPVINVNYAPSPKTDRGVFIGTGADIVDKTATELTYNQNDLHELRSIPNIWARCMIWQIYFGEYYDMTRQNARQPIHASINAAIGEWRGLIAALVLQSHYHVAIQSMPINLDDQRSGYLKAISDIKPKRVAFYGDRQWERTVLFYMDVCIDEQFYARVPLGLTSPTTLVCTAADAASFSAEPRNVLADSLNKQPIDLPFSWYQNGRFTDPLLNPDCLSIADLIVLKDWLTQTTAYLQAMRAEDVNYANPLIDLLQRYQASIPLNRIPSALADIWRQQGTALVSWTWNRKPESDENIMYRLLSGSYRINPDLPSIAMLSDLLMVYQGESQIVIRHEGFDDQIVFGIYDRATYMRGLKPITRTVPATMVRDAKAVDKWDPKLDNRKLVVQAMQQSGKFLPIVDEQVLTNRLFMPMMYYLDIEDLYELDVNGNRSKIWQVAEFIENYCWFLSEERKSDASNGRLLYQQYRIFILPVTQTLAEQADHDLSERTVSIIPLAAGYRIMVRLPAGTFSKDYQPDQISAIPMNQLPVAALWPRYRLSPDPKTDWKNFYFYSLLDDSLRYYFDLDSQTKTMNSIVHATRDGIRTARINQITSFPRTLRLYQSGGQGSECLGYVALKQPEMLTVQNKTGTLDISVDFGTSSTVIYKRATAAAGQNSDPEEMVINPAVAIVCCSRSQENVLARYFITPYPVRSPFPTLAQLSSKTLYQSVFLDANAYFQKHKNEIVNGITSNRYGVRLAADIKLQDDAQVRTIIAVYIEQLVMMTALQARLEGYVQVNWHFSYPLTTDNAADYIRICQDTVHRYLDKGIGINGLAANMTESEAAARHFLRPGEGYHIEDREVAVIDIGGGSADIFIFTRAGQLLTSVLLGARKMLLDLFNNNRSFLVGLTDYAFTGRINYLDNFPFKDVVSQKALLDPTSLINTSERDIFDLFMETLLGTEIEGSGQKFGEYLSLHVSSMNESVLHRQAIMFQTILAFYIGALFYYCGMLQKYLMEKNNSSNVISRVCLAGNGSNIIDWILHGGNAVAQKNCDIFIEGAGLAGLQQNISMVRSTARKSEAAKGLLSPPLQKNGNPIPDYSIDKVILTGLQLSIREDQQDIVHKANSNIFDYLQELKASNIEHMRISDFTEFDKFISIFNKAYAAQIEKGEILPIYLIEQKLTADTGPSFRISKETLGDSIIKSIGQTASKPQKNYSSLFMLAIDQTFNDFMLDHWKSNGNQKPDRMM